MKNLVSIIILISLFAGCRKYPEDEKLPHFRTPERRLIYGNWESVSMINNNNSGDCLTAVKHGNGRDWWVMNKLSTHTTVSHLNRFFVYLVTGDSIYTPLVQDLGTASDADLQKIIWHPSGEKFMLINHLNQYR